MEDGKKCERLAREIFDMFRVGTNASLISKAQRVLTSGHAMSYALFYHPEGMTASELAEIGDCSPSRVTAIMNHWEEKGIAKRFQKPGDRLHTYVRITEKGREQCLKFGQIMLDFIVKVLTKLGAEKAEVVLEALQTTIEIGLQSVKEWEERKC